MRHRIATPIVVLAIACTTSGDTRAKDTGSACVLTNEDSELVPGPQRFHVVLADCESGCTDEIDAQCSVSVDDDDGSTLHVTASASWDDDSGGGGSCSSSGTCPSVCIPIEAVCTTDALPAGTYTVEYDGSTFEMELPSTPPEPLCAGGTGM